ncbi:trafficking protein particle complex subunit 8 isoform X3 [Morus notabilis]|uniref:trafficking protein particle complex subunit 8 isoform X3 n=1 Tax=Morus notabilis TaxID=981085 RepID=UPI000CECE984|nr:trafficking protein particle complex subunit 8 isoform X3 [Morus notabilis]
MADPAKTPLGKMLLDEINPVVMVLDTPLVEETCRKNGLSFVEMLSPFCVFNNIDVPVRTASDQPYRLQKFRLRLFYASDIRQPNLEVARERLKQVITQAGENGDSELCSDPPPIENLDARFESENLPSWFAFFNKELVRSASFSDHEAFDHPVACLLVVSSKDEQPINQFVDLFNTNKLPSLLNDGAMDPKILNYYLLVHDNQDGTTDKATKILTEMRSTFGSDCQLLCINSSEDGPVEHQDNPWKSETSSGQNLGSFLNVNDINEMRDIMQELSTKQIIPCMEQKIRVLNQQVSATRKGFKNQIKSLWWRKGKDEIADSSNGSMYTFSSVESQIRVLGDYAFMLRDYELALSNYRLISTDYKLDKAWKRYAGVQEMMGLSYFLLDQSRKEAEYCLENAFTTYLKIGPSGQQNATRCGLWWVEMLKTRYQFREAASVYFRICGEEPLHSAVMLEQASYCYLLSTPPMLHKYGFHLVLSGERYKKSDQIKHAIRTYKNAISVYKEATWSHIKDHIYFNIGQWYAYLGRYDLAVSHVLEVLACSHQSKTSQDIFLRQFLQIVQKTGRIFEVPKLQLPEIKISSLRVIFEDHRTYATPAVASVKESIWRSLEEDLIPSLSTGRTNWLELHSKLVAKTYKESNVCVAGEAVRVDFEIKNPLQIPISVSSVSLICELAASSDETQTDANSQAGKLQNDNELTMTTSRESDNNSFLTLSKVDFSLGGGEVVMVQLTVTPRIEGILQIVGVRWNLSSAVVGFHNFESNPRRKKSAKGRQRGNRSLSDNLKFVVIKSLPKLEGFIQPLPTSTYAGDVRHLVLELRNQSECTVKNLKLKVSHPRFLNVGSQESLDADFPACLEKRTEHHYVQPDHNNISQPVFIFPEDTIITAETPLLWPLWFRAAVPGNISLYLTIYYEIEDSSSSMRYRTLRMHHNVQVLPSLGISFQVSPCPSKLEEFLVQMDVVNRTSTKSFQVHQLASVGEQWEISLLEPVDTILPSQCLVAGQSLSCFFMLKNQRKSGISENKTSSTSVPLGSVVRLGPEGSTEPLFDTSSSPLVDFHRNERLHQEISHQGDSTVDFILISRSLKSDLDSGTSDPPQLFSHHSCHCSIESRSPISWLVDGPRTMYHNFSESFCEIKLSMTIYNSSNAIASVHINTLDSSGNSSDATSDQSATSSSNQVGWHDVSLVTDIKVTSDVLGARFGKPPTLDSVSPFIWSASSSTRVLIEPMTAVEIPLKICVFSPGTYDLSNYLLHWNLVPPNGKQNLDEGIRQSSGTCQGYLYYLTVLQSA